MSSNKKEKLKWWIKIKRSDAFQLLIAVIVVSLICLSAFGILFGSSWLLHKYPKVTQSELNKHVLVDTVVNVDLTEDKPYEVAVTFTFPDGSALYPNAYVSDDEYTYGFALNKLGIFPTYKVLSSWENSFTSSKIAWFVPDSFYDKLPHIFSRKEGSSKTEGSLLPNPYTETFRFYSQKEMQDFTEALHKPETWNETIEYYTDLYNKGYKNKEEARKYKEGLTSTKISK